MLREIYQTIISENSAKLYDQLKDAGWTITSSYNGNVETTPDQATSWILTSYTDDAMESVTIRLPANRTIDKILNLIAKKQASNSVFMNLSNYMNMIVRNKSLSVFATSYGIGVVSIYNKNSSSEITEIESELDKLNVQYTNEHSDARWVYRFKVSKNAHNMNIIKTLI